MKRRVTRSITQAYTLQPTRSNTVTQTHDPQIEILNDVEPLENCMI